MVWAARQQATKCVQQLLYARAWVDAFGGATCEDMSVSNGWGFCCGSVALLYVDSCICGGCLFNLVYGAVESCCNAAAVVACKLATAPGALRVPRSGHGVGVAVINLQLLLLAQLRVGW
jgi:hypothetical protein